MTSIITINGISLKNTIKGTFTKSVNEKSTADIRLDGTTDFDRSNFSIGSTVTFEENGVTEFQGRIKNISRFEAGGLKIYVMGEEHYQYSNTPVEDNLGSLGTNGVWTSDTSANIFTELLNAAPSWTAGTIDSSLSNHDFRVSRDQSLWNGIQNLLSDTGQRMVIDYTNQQIDILDSIGTSNNFSFIENQNISSPQFIEDEPEGLKVLVFGKGDGEFQIVGSATDGSYTIGDPVVKITDPNIISTSQANQRASIELNTLSENKLNYDFRVVRSDLDIGLGDTGTLTAPSASIDNETIRIVQIEKGVRGNDSILNVEVTNSAYLRRLKKRDDKLIELEKEIRSFKSGKQDSGNTEIFGDIAPATSSLPLIVPFTISANDYEDDAGNINVSSFKFSYDIDVFRQTAGGATGSGFDADVRGDSGNNDPPVENDTGLDNIDTDEAFNETIGSGGSNTTLQENVPFVSGSVDYTIVTLVLTRRRDDWSVNEGSYEVRLVNGTTGSIYIDKTGVLEFAGEAYVQTIIISGDIEGDQLSYTVTDNTTTSYDYGMSISISTVSEHEHPPGLMNAENHPHDDGTYDTDDDAIANAIVIGESINDASSVNATGISWELQYFSGGSWSTVNSGSESFPSGQTFNTDLDLSSGGTYPNATGFWRLVLYTDSTDADTAKAKVNIKHNLNNS